MTARPPTRLWRVRATGHRAPGDATTRHPPFYVRAGDLGDATTRAYALLNSIDAARRWDLTVTAEKGGTR